jgi:hypothetical protein
MTERTRSLGDGFGSCFVTHIPPACARPASRGFPFSRAPPRWLRDNCSGLCATGTGAFYSIWHCPTSVGKE